MIAPARGIIYDRNGVALAGNEQIYRVSMIREDADDVDAVIGRLRQLVRLDEEVLGRAIREMDRRPHQSVTLADRLSWDELSSVAINVPALPGITPEVGLSRVYPLGQDYAHVIGYVGRVSERDLAEEEDPDPLLQTPQFQIGKIGAERLLEDVLRGRAGARRVEQNASGRIMRELGRTEGKSGADVQLTIDAGLQNFTQARLGIESASAVVLDVRTGDILAAVSSPSYDPNLFVEGISVPDYAGLRDNDHRPLHNKIVQGLYPPGSTFKMVTLLAALDAGAIGPGETVYCNGSTTISNRRFHCWKRGGHGQVDIAKSLRESCDVFYYEMAQRAGIDRIAAMARKMGLGTAFDVEMSSVSEGPDPRPRLEAGAARRALGDRRQRQRVDRAGLRPRLAAAARGDDGPDRQRPRGQSAPRPVRRRRRPAVRRGRSRSTCRAAGSIGRATACTRSVNAKHGTGGGSKFDLAGMKWAGKSGTSQVRNITAAERARGVSKNEDLPWSRRDHALFVGYAPYDDPRYSVSVVVEHGSGGSAVAAPVARDIMLYALSGGMPPLDAYPSSQRERAEELLSGLVLHPGLTPPPAKTEA